jgi:hypothetical protein
MYCGDASPEVARLPGGSAVKLIHICYAAVGFVIARWIFHRQALPVVDPVTRFRASGLL